YQSAAEVAVALLPWVQTPVPPPAAEDLLRPSPAARAAEQTDDALGALTPLTGGATAPVSPALPTGLPPAASTGPAAAPAGRAGPGGRGGAPAGGGGGGPPSPRRSGGRRWAWGAAAGAAGVLIAGGVLGLLAYTAATGKGSPRERPADEAEAVPRMRLLVPA